MVLDVQKLKMKKDDLLHVFPLMECDHISIPRDLIDQQLTFGLFKPDLVTRGLMGEAIRKIEDRHLKVLAISQVFLGRELAEEFYAEHKDRPFYEELVQYMSSGPSLAIIMIGRDGVKRWRDLMGPTNPFDAKRSSSSTLRAIYGIDKTRNSFHGSDSVQSAAREITFACRNFKMLSHEYR